MTASARRALSAALALAPLLLAAWGGFTLMSDAAAENLFAYAVMLPSAAFGLLAYRVWPRKKA